MDSERKGLIFSKGRLETLTDGVFAIIMTILVFNLSVPELLLFAEGDYASERLSAKIASLWPDFLAYLISFSTLGVYWVSHHRIFRWILYVNRPLIGINLSFLMVIGISTLLNRFTYTLHGPSNFNLCIFIKCNPCRYTNIHTILLC